IEGNQFAPEHCLIGPTITEITFQSSCGHSQVCKLNSQNIMAKMKKEISQVLLSLLQVGIQPMAETGTAHEWSKQRNIAIISSITSATANVAARSNIIKFIGNISRSIKPEGKD